MVCDRCKKEDAKWSVSPLGEGNIYLCTKCAKVFYRQAEEFVKAFLKGVHNG